MGPDWVEVADRSAIVYDVEFIRALAVGASVAVAHRVALEQLALEHPSQAGIAFLLPGPLNGYGRITEELKEIRQRLVVLEQKVDALGADGAGQHKGGSRVVEPMLCAAPMAR